jgi:hypothetical protein
LAAGVTVYVAVPLVLPPPGMARFCVTEVDVELDELTVTCGLVDSDTDQENVVPETLLGLLKLTVALVPEQMVCAAVAEAVGIVFTVATTGTRSLGTVSQPVDAFEIYVPT